MLEVTTVLLPDPTMSLLQPTMSPQMQIVRRRTINSSQRLVVLRKTGKVCAVAFILVSGILTLLPGKQPGKRRRDSPDPDIRLYRRRLVSPPADGASCLEKLESNPVALVLSKLEQVLKKAQATEEENRLLRAELAAIRQRQDRLEEMVRRHDKRAQDLEAEGAELDTRVDGLEERQAELEDRQGRMEDKCDTIEIEISDQVSSALRERLLGALETM